MAAILNFCQNLKMPKGAKPAPVRTFIQKALTVQITNNLVEGYFLKVVKKSNALHLYYKTCNFNVMFNIKKNADLYFV